MKPRNFPDRKEGRRERAAARQAAYDALSLDQRLQRARPRSREARRISGQLEEQRKAAATDDAPRRNPKRKAS